MAKTVSASDYRKLVEIIEKISENYRQTFIGNSKDAMEDLLREIVKMKKRMMASEEEWTNDRLSSEIRKIVNKTIEVNIQNQSVKDLFRNLDPLHEFTIRLHNDLNGIRAAEEFITGRQKALIEEVMGNFTSRGFNSFYRNPLVQVIKKSVSENASITETEALIERYIENDPYPANTAFNAVMQYDGAVNQEIADEYELNDVIYTGSVVESSRKQCRRWLGFEGRVIKGEDLADEIEWSKRYGSGQNPACNTNNFLIYRGGYNCRHIATPVRID